jgi:hypothetical protein
MRFVKAFRHYAHVRPEDGVIETVDPGSVVLMDDDLARVFVARGNGEFHPGPARLVRPAPGDVERPGLDTRPGRAERAVAPPQAQARPGAI